MRFLLREVARRLSGVPGPFQHLYPLVQRGGHPFQRLDPSVGCALSFREQPADPRRNAGKGRAEQLGRERGKVKVMHEASMGPRRRGDTHASGAYIIGMTRFPPPPAGMFETTVLFGHTSTVAPSDVPSDFSSG